MVPALAGPARPSAGILGGIPPTDEHPQPSGYTPQPPGGRGFGGGRGTGRFYGHGKTARIFVPPLPRSAGKGRLPLASAPFGTALPNLLRDVSSFKAVRFGFGRIGAALYCETSASIFFSLGAKTVEKVRVYSGRSLFVKETKF